MKRYVPGIIFTLVVMLLGLAIGWLAQGELLPNPLVTASYQVDIAGLAPRAGILAGVLIFVVFLAGWWFQREFERKQVQAQDEQSSARQRFFQRLDHELKNPLTIIRLGIVNLQQSPNLHALTAEQGNSLERISQQVQRLQKLVVDLRLLSELDQGSIE